MNTIKTVKFEYQGMNLRISTSKECSDFVVGVNSDVYAIYGKFGSGKYNISCLSNKYEKEQQKIERLLSTKKAFPVINTAMQILNNQGRD